MKKLFFAALLATVAVGGAFALDYRNTPGVSDPGKVEFNCSGLGTTCGATYTKIYDNLTGAEILDQDIYAEAIQY